MLNRFDKDYKLVITTKTNTITIQPPLNIAFDCEKSINSFGLNRCNLKVYNLKQSNINQLVKDADQTNIYIRVELFAGYKNNIKQIFRGNIYRSYPVKNGADVILILECMDGLRDVKTSFTSATATTKRKAVEEIVKTMPNTEIGKITDQNEIYRNKVMMGNSYEELKKLLKPDEIMYIEDEKLYIIKNNELGSNYISIINAETGLMNIPSRENQMVTVETRLNPSLKVGGVAKLESIYASYLDGNYRIETLSFKGTYDGSDWDQTVKMRQYEK